MIRIGVLLIPTAVILFILSNAVSFFIINIKASLILFIGSILIGISGPVLIFTGVLRDRINDKKGEDTDDLSQY